MLGESDRSFRILFLIKRMHAQIEMDGKAVGERETERFGSLVPLIENVVEVVRVARVKYS